MLKKTASLVLVLVMLLTFIPCASAATVASGKCGNNVTWTYNSNGTLTVSGSGDMWDADSEFSYDSDFGTHYNESGDFLNYSIKAKNVVIKNGVTSVGAWVFSLQW